MDVNHPYLSHPVRGWGRSFGTQSGQLAVSGLLSVQRRMIDRVCGAGPTIRACGADGGTVKSPHDMFWMFMTRVGVRSMGCSHGHSSLLEQVWICIQALISPGQTVALPTHVLIWLDIPSLQDGTGTRGNRAGRGVGVRQTVSWDSGTPRYGALPWTKRDSGGRWGHGVGSWWESSLHGMV